MNNKKNSARIVLVDDESDALEIMEEQLQMGGFNVVGKASDGKEAVDAYFQLRPDVVILDIMMPKFDGFYALEKIKMDNLSAKVIVITADFSQESKQRLKENNADVVLYKPYKIEHVVRAITDLTDNPDLDLMKGQSVPFHKKTDEIA